jgi:hypothetical protein
MFGMELLKHLIIQKLYGTFANQSSDWSGTLFGLHDWADRPPKKEVLNDWKTGNSMNQEPSLNIMM